MVGGAPWKGVAIVGVAAMAAAGRCTPSTMATSVSFCKLRGLFENQRKEIAPLCACWKAQVLTTCRLCKVEPTIDWTSLRVSKVARLRVSSAFVGNKTRQPSLIRGVRIATEVPDNIVKQAPVERDLNEKPNSDESEESEGSELEEGESTELPKELCEELDTAAWSVGLDAFNVAEVPSNVCVLGIDPDASGAIAVLRACSQEVLDVPCVKVQIGKTMRRRHDASSMVDLVNGINAPEGSVAYVEQAMPFPKDGKQGWYGCGFGYGMWVGILMALGFKVVPVRAQAWKSAMGISGRQYTKDDSRSLAVALFPDLGPQLKRKKDHGRADAILIAAFGKGLLPPPKLLDVETDSTEQN